MQSIREKAAKTRADGIEAAGNEPVDSKNKSFSTRKSEAFLGYTVGNLLPEPGPNKMNIGFGRWNDRNQNETKARGIADSMKNGVRRFDLATVIEVPISRSDLTSNGLKLLAKSRKAKIADIERGNLPYVEAVLQAMKRRIDLLSGQHRQRAVKIHCEFAQEQVTQKSQKLVDNDAAMKELEAGSPEYIELEKENKRLEEEIAVLKNDLELGGKWLFALYDRG